MSRPRRAAARCGLALACVVVLVAPPLGAQQPPVAGVVKNLTGTVAVVRAGQPVPVTPGQPIAEGDTVRTGADGRLGLTLKDGTRLSLGGHTELRIDTFGGYGTVG